MRALGVLTRCVYWNMFLSLSEEQKLKSGWCLVTKHEMSQMKTFLSCTIPMSVCTDLFFPGPRWECHMPSSQYCLKNFLTGHSCPVGAGQCYHEGFFFMCCFQLVCICNTKHIHVLYLLKNAEMKYQVANAAPGCGILAVQLYLSGCCWVKNSVMHSVKGSGHKRCAQRLTWAKDSCLSELLQLMETWNLEDSTEHTLTASVNNKCLSQLV